MFFNNFTSCLILLTIFGQLLFGGDRALAESQTNESGDRTVTEASELPPTKPRSQTRRSGSTRGECEADNNNNNIILMVPSDNESLFNIPKTTSTHPTFYWYMAQKSDLPVKFTLVERGKTIYVKEFSSLEEGLISLTLPDSIPMLEISKQYRWTVSILCSRQHPSRNPYTQAWVERVSPSPFFKENLSCDTYKKAQIWYDTFSCIMENQSEVKIFELLEEVNLTDLPVFSKRDK